jgi:hypothetical protein
MSANVEKRSLKNWEKIKPKRDLIVLLLVSKLHISWKLEKKFLVVGLFNISHFNKCHFFAISAFHVRVLYVCSNLESVVDPKVVNFENFRT